MVETKDTDRPGRGAIAPGKTQVNWRIKSDVLDALRTDMHRLGLESVVAVVNHLLTKHYFGGQPLD